MPHEIGFQIKLRVQGIGTCPGKEKNKYGSKKQKVGRVYVGKAVIWGALERKGEFRAIHLDFVKDVKKAVRFAHVSTDATLVTDEYAGYNGLSNTYDHKTVNHSAGEYAHTGNHFHTNSIVSAWSHIKRQIYDIHHWISDKHLSNYLYEMIWHYNRRDIEDGYRMNEFLGV